MRYGDWDVLLFRTESRAPIKEFKVACHVVDDPEFTQAQGSFGLPNVCCFIPSQDAGSPFQISVHSWEPPSISQVTRAYSKHTEDVKFEARLFVDGRLTTSSFFERKSMWPYVIANSFHFSKNGDLEPLRFPLFRQELLHQNYWAPGDDVGRIKIIISEGFPRDSASMPFERVKNLVAFSFQHAPLDVLESSGIAWPNPIMWQRHAHISSMPVPTYSYSESETHAHSPRRLRGSDSNPSTFTMTTSQLSTAAGSSDTSAHGGCGRTEYPPASRSRQLQSIDESMDWIADVNELGRPHASFQDNKYAIRKARMSKTDESMPDFVFKPEEEISKSAVPSQPVEESLFTHLKASSNTPTNAMNMSNLGDCEDCNFSIFHPNMSIPIDLANSLTSSLLSQPQPCQPQNHPSNFPAPEIRSRKEARSQQSESGRSPSDVSATSIPTFHQQYDQHHDLRKVSQQVYIPSGESLPTTIAQPNTLSHQPGKSGITSETGRTVSSGGFGANMTGVASLTGADPMLRNVSGNAGAKDSKQSQNFTSESSKAIDNEDQAHQSRHASSRIRLTPFVEDADDNP